MKERLQQLPKRLLELWNKYTSKQKTIIVSVFSGVVLALAILIVLLSRTKYVTLSTFETTNIATGVVQLLKENGIKYKLQDDNLTVEVDRKRQTDAVVLVAQSDLEETGFGIDDLLNTSISTTSGERLTRAHLYMQSDLKKNIENMVGVDKAIINYVPQDSSTTILTAKKDTPASVFLTINDEFDKEETPVSIAVAVAFAIGNSSTEQIRVVDQYGVMLYDGSDPDEEEEITQDEIAAFKNEIALAYKNLVYAGFAACQYQLTEVMPSITVNMDKKETYTERYYPDNPDMEQGYQSHYESYSATGVTNSGDIPGTDSNDEVDYMLVNSMGGTSSVDSESYDMIYNKQITNEIYETGVVDKESSFISVVATHVEEVSEAELREKELLTEDMTYEQFQLLFGKPVKTEPSEDLYQMVAKATGIPRENIHITTYDQYKFIEILEEPVNWEFILTIVLAVLLLAFLAYVVFRGMKPVEVTEVEPELNYSEILAEHGNNASLEDVEFGEKSETRILIEKFFDENPESVAMLLRTWLNDEY
ncbi:MAG: hypothetical protein IJ427_10480 [Lachnospiraceae bacterium]|nr:hypothetical protein [Lachnospiraceae bacterium]